MGLDDFASSAGSTSDGSGASTHREIDASTAANHDHKRWHTKIDFSNPYVVVARDRKGRVYVHRGDLAVLDNNDDWRRLDDHPKREFEVIFTKGERRDWLRFCHRAVSQLDVDPEDVIDEDPGRLPHIEDRINVPPGYGFDGSRTCQICGASSDSNELTMMEVDLQKHRKVAMCSSHTVEEMARNGLLE
jgi:hypothetical protein